MAELYSEYKEKLITAKQAAELVKPGDYLEFGYGQSKPMAIDHELALRKDELFGVEVHSSTCYRPFHIFEADRTGKHFRYSSGHCSAQERRFVDEGFGTYIPSMLGQNSDWLERGWRKNDITMLSVAPMDEKGYFNFGPVGTFLKTCVETAKIVVVEINPQMPRCLDGQDEGVHISEIDFIVEDPRANCPMEILNSSAPNDADRKTAELIVEEVEDGSCIQLGIGALPNLVGNMIANSDLKDLGIHTEMFNTAMLEMTLAGKITGRRKNIDKNKIVYTFALGSKEVYEFIDDNPALAMYPCSYTNHPAIIMRNDRAISVNNCIEVDLSGQVCAESAGTRHISGSGGQLEFAIGAYYSKGGKSIICLSSAFEQKNGEVVSRIKPILTSGAVVTTTRAVVNYLVTEHGKVNLKGKSLWERAELIISLADPRFRDDLIEQAKILGVWKKSNKIA